MRRRTEAFGGLAIAAMACLCLAIACAARHPTVKERQTVQHWLLCEECMEGERDAAVALGDRAIPMLREAFGGPPAASRENVRRQFEALDARLPPPPLPMTRVLYVERAVSNYVATYQSRAAIALGLIGTPRAQDILLRAVRNDTASRADVLQAIGGAAPILLTRVAGDSQSAPADSTVRIDPSVRLTDVRDSATPRPLANVRVVFRVESGGGRVIDSVQRTNALGRASVRWQLGPGVDTVNVLSVVAAGRTVRFRATGRGIIPRLVFVVQPHNGRSGQPMDTVVVAAVDAWGQTDVTFTKPALLAAIGTSFSSTGSFSAGRSFFPGLVINVVSTGLRLRVGALGATPALSVPFDILP